MDEFDDNVTLRVQRDIMDNYDEELELEPALTCEAF
jgi:hypothetical protein